MSPWIRGTIMNGRYGCEVSYGNQFDRRTGRGIAHFIGSLTRSCTLEFEGITLCANISETLPPK